MQPKQRSKNAGLEPASVLIGDVNAPASLERLALVFTRGKPLVAQFVDQIALLVVARALRPSERLPTLDDATRLFGIARNTLTQAYQLLEQHGITTSKTRAGTYFTSNAELAARHYLIARDSESLIAHAQALDIKREEIVTVFLATLDRMERSTTPLNEG